MRTHMYSDNITTKHIVGTKILKEIIFNEGKVLFNHVKDRTDCRKHRLTEIEVIPYNATIVKKIKFDNSAYFNGPRLKLNSISFLGSDSKIYDSYTFDYFDGDMPPPYSISIHSGSYNPYFSQDLLGYYNAAANVSLVYNPINRSAFANRDFNFNAARTYTLKSISYITGGKTEFIYDAYPGNVARSPALRIKEIISQNSRFNNNNKEHKIYRYGNDVSSGSQYINYPTNFIKYSYHESISCESKTEYKEIIKIMKDNQGKTIYELIELHLNWFNFHPYAESIKQYTSNPSMLNLEQMMHYQYGTVEELCVSENRTDTLKTIYTFENEKPSFLYVNTTSATNTCAIEKSIYPSFYMYVYNQMRSHLTLSGYPVKQGWASGLLKSKEIYKHERGVFRLIEKTVNEFKKLKEDKITTGLHLEGLLYRQTNPYGSKCRLLPEIYYPTEVYLKCKSLNNYFFYDIFEYTGWKKIEKTITTRYEDNLPRVPITKTESYNYGSIAKTIGNHPFITKKIEEVSSGESQEYEFKYPVDYQSQESYRKMVDSNYTNAVINKICKLKKPYNMSAVINERIEYDDSLFPYKSTRTFSKIQGENVVATDSLQLTILSRTDTGKPLETVDETGLNCVYVWDTNNIIAEIRNARLSEVRSALNNNLQYLQFIGGAGMPEGTIDLLRRNLLNAHITSYTYKPLVGITSMKDPSGITTYYEYDSANRLKSSYIEDANGLKRMTNSYNYHLNRE